MRLADLLTQQQHAIEERWLERVRPLAPRAGLTREELVDSLPAFLAELARALRHLEDASVTSALPESSPVAEAHGQQRHRFGYATEAVAREYPLLHEVILLVAATSGVAVSAWESILLARCMGTATAEALSHFAAASELELRRSEGDARLQHAFTAEQLLRVQAAERKARESAAAAEAERKKLHDIFEQAPVLIAIVEVPDFIFTFANPAYRALLGGLDVEGKSLPEVLPEFEGQLRALVDGVVASGVAFVGREVPIRLPHRAPGEDQFFDFVYQPMFDAEGRVRGILACGYDVTDQVRARQQVQRLAAQLEAILQSFPEPLFVADATGVTRANAAGLRLLGATSMEALEQDMATLYQKAFIRRADTGEPLEPKDNLLVRALEGHTVFLDCIMRDPITGADRVMRSAAAPVRVGEQVVGTVAFSTDITERIQAERSLRERADFEQKLIGIVGHDLRQPLQTIAMSAGILLMRPGLDERALVGVQRITAAAARMQRMLHDILDFTRARLGGGIPLERVQSDIGQLAREAAEEVALVHPERQVEVAVEGSAEGRWDADRLRQVLDNLLTNALAYSPAGTPVRLEVDGRTPGEVHVRVHNAGAPIPAEILPVLFQPMTRGTRAAGAERSVGLGLFIVRHLVEAHGGRVEVASTEAEGTTFSVHLPRG
jgi:PAS domain S-box-containing protein